MTEIKFGECTPLGKKTLGYYAFTGCSEKNELTFKVYRDKHCTDRLLLTSHDDLEQSKCIIGVDKHAFSIGWTGKCLKKIDYAVGPQGTIDIVEKVYTGTK